MRQLLYKTSRVNATSMATRSACNIFNACRQAYTGCTNAADPAGESGRQWCYVEAQARHDTRMATLLLWSPHLLQLQDSNAVLPAWNYCGRV